MKTVEEVLQKYTLGEAGKDETNDGLKELGSPLRLNPDRRVPYCGNDKIQLWK